MITRIYCKVNPFDKRDKNFVLAARKHGVSNISRETGISIAHVSQFLSGEKSLCKENYLKIAELIGVPA